MLIHFVRQKKQRRTLPRKMTKRCICCPQDFTQLAQMLWTNTCLGALRAFRMQALKTPTISAPPEVFERLRTQVATLAEKIAENSAPPAAFERLTMQVATLAEKMTEMQASLATMATAWANSSNGLPRDTSATSQPSSSPSGCSQDVRPGKDPTLTLSDYQMKQIWKWIMKPSDMEFDQVLQVSDFPARVASPRSVIWWVRDPTWPI